MAEPKSIYAVGGTVQASGGLYIERAADRELLELCCAGTLAFVLSSRQVGKSSLMVHTAQQLKKENIRSAIIDLNTIGVDLPAEQWYLGILNEITNSLELQTNIFEWWEKQGKLGAAQQFSNFCREVLLREVQDRVILFFDEIDSTLSTSFSDDFFAALRAIYNNRPNTPDFERLSFVLIGVATPDELMSDSKRTPFNIGQRVDVTDFTLQEARPLAEGLKNGPPQVLEWVFEWTSGHPFLTQSLCAALAKQTGPLTKESVARVTQELFLQESGQQNSNLQFVRDTLLKRAKNPVEVLYIYSRVLTNETVEDDEHSINNADLKLSGMVRRTSSNLLRVSNEIYTRVFDLKWVDQNLSTFKSRDSLQVGALEWERAKKDRSHLLRGRQLADAEQFLSDHREVTQRGIVWDFVISSRRNQERERNLVLVGVGLVMIAMMFLAAFAWNRSNIAVRARSTAENLRSTAVSGATNAVQALETTEAESTRAANAQATSSVLQATSSVLEGAATANAALAQEVLKTLSRGLAATARERMDTNYIYGLLLGVESYRLLEINHLAQGQAPDAVPPLLDRIPNGLMQNLELSSGPVRKVLYSPNGNILLSLSGTVDIWDTKNPAMPEPFPGWEAPTDNAPSDLAFSPDGKLMVIGYQDGRVEIWGVETSEMNLLATFKDFSSPVRVAVSTDGRFLAAGDEAVKLWDITDPHSPELVGGIRYPHEISDRPVDVNYLTFAPGSNMLLVSGGLDHYLRVWNFIKSNYKPSKAIGNVFQVHVDPPPVAINSNYLIVADKELIRVFFYDTIGDRELAGASAYKQVHPGLIKNIVISPDSKRLYTTAQDGVIGEWNLEDPRHLRFIGKFDGPMKSIDTVALHHDGDVLAVAGNNTIALWSLSQRTSAHLWSSQILKNNEDITDIAYSPKLNLLAVGDDGGAVQLWNIADPSHPVKRRSTSIGNPIRSLAFSPDDTALWFLGDFADDATLPRVFSRNLARLDFSDNIPQFATNTAEVFAVGQNYILTGENDHGKISIVGLDVLARWTVNRDPAFGLADCPFQDTAYSREGRLVAVAACDVQLWNFPGDGVPTLIEELDTSAPRGVAFSQDGGLLASANANGTISLWKVDTFSSAKLLSTIINAHFGAVTAVAISPDGNTLASGGEDRAIILWDITDPEHPFQRVTLHGHTGGILNGGIFFVLDGRAIISASGDEVLFWDNDSRSWIEKACGIAGRNFTQSEWAQLVGPAIPYHATCSNLPVPGN